MSKICSCGLPMSKDAKTCKNCTKSSSESNPNWKGGSIYHKKGYIMRRVNGRYIFEHVLVMEDFLGRKLLPGENVHHKNGVRNDNRLENLELWCKPQPVGCRAEDAYAWAQEIISRYGELFTAPTSIDV